MDFFSIVCPIGVLQEVIIIRSCERAEGGAEIFVVDQAVVYADL